VADVEGARRSRDGEVVEASTLAMPTGLAGEFAEQDEDTEARVLSALYPPGRLPEVITQPREWIGGT
jgi:hypothetical protein